MRYLTIFEVLAIAEEVTGIPLQTLLPATKLDILEAAVNSPQMVFDGLDPYPNLEDKIAVLGFQIARNHPLPDGNKRLAFSSMTLTAILNGFDFEIENDSAEETILKLAAGEFSREELAQWIKQVMKPI